MSGSEGSPTIRAGLEFAYNQLCVGYMRNEDLRLRVRLL